MNNMAVSVTPKYIPLVQKPCCCCMTCLQMILYRRGYGLFDQQELAEYFKVKVGKYDVAAFNVKLDAYTALDKYRGIKTIESEELINKFFREKRIALKAKAVKSSEISNLEEFLYTNLMRNNDLWMEYICRPIHNEAGGHDGLIESISKGKDGTKVVLIDSCQFHKPRIEVEIEKIHAAITGKLRGRDIGFVVISAS